MAERKSGNADESDRLERVFLDRYPRQELAAEMYLEQATNLLAGGQSEAADKKLAMIAEYFPHSNVAERASYIRSQLKQPAAVTRQ
jgi:TolA-binding protein